MGTNTVKAWTTSQGQGLFGSFLVFGPDAQKDEITITFGTGKITGQCYQDSICAGWPRTGFCEIRSASESKVWVHREEALDKHFLCEEARWHLLMTCNLRLEMLMCKAFQRIAFTLVLIRILRSDWLCVFNGQLYLFDSSDLRIVEVSDDYFLMLASQREKGLNSWSAKMLEWPVDYTDVCSLWSAVLFSWTTVYSKGYCTSFLCFKDLLSVFAKQWCRDLHPTQEESYAPFASFSFDGVLGLALDSMAQARNESVPWVFLSLFLHRLLCQDVIWFILVMQLQWRQRLRLRLSVSWPVPQSLVSIQGYLSQFFQRSCWVRVSACTVQRVFSHEPAAAVGYFKVMISDRSAPNLPSLATRGESFILSWEGATR